MQGWEACTDEKSGGKGGMFCKATHVNASLRVVHISRGPCQVFRFRGALEHAARQLLIQHHGNIHRTEQRLLIKALTDNGRNDLRYSGLGLFGRCLDLCYRGGRLAALGGGGRGGCCLDQSLLLFDDLPLDVLERRLEDPTAGGRRRGAPVLYGLSEEVGGLLVLVGGQRAAGLGGDVEGLRRGEQEAQEDDGGPHVCDVRPVRKRDGRVGGEDEDGWRAEKN